ncbi:MAG: DNA methyltransferase [Candidatus Aenigmatarchaeota archaeon]
MAQYRIVEKTEWGPLATFVPNKKEPVYNWLYYKEGFSRELVLKLIKTFSLKGGMLVLDPFCGVGTTLLACKEMGINSFGFDVHPVAVFASQVKTRDYETGILKQEIKNLIKAKFKPPKNLPESSIVRRVFPRKVLEDVVFFRDIILENSDRKVRDFLILGLMNASIKCSYAHKDGAVIKVMKKPIPPLRDMLRRQLFRMVNDLEKIKTERCEISSSFGDARSLPIDDEIVDAVITSPPYLNKIEYTKVYEIEQELFLSKVQNLPPLRSYIGVSFNRLEKDIPKLERVLDYETAKSLPLESVPYFVDMFQSIEEMFRVCKKGSKIGMVVGNGCFPTGVVDSDIILSNMAECLGFKVEKILVLNKRWCTRNRVEKVGITRESLLLWEK